MVRFKAREKWTEDRNGKRKRWKKIKIIFFVREIFQKWGEVLATVVYDIQEIFLRI